MFRPHGYQGGFNNQALQEEQELKSCWIDHEFGVYPSHVFFFNPWAFPNNLISTISFESHNSPHKKGRVGVITLCTFYMKVLKLREVK